MDQGATTVDGVFPGVGKGEVYYDWYTLAAVNASAGENVTIDAPLGHIPVYIRGNNVIPTQEPALVTRDARKNPWGLIAALSLEGSAAGSLYVDDGESLVPNATLYVEVRPLCPPRPARIRSLILVSSPLRIMLCTPQGAVRIKTPTRSPTSRSWACSLPSLMCR